MQRTLVLSFGLVACIAPPGFAATKATKAPTTTKVSAANAAAAAAEKAVIASMLPGPVPTPGTVTVVAYAKNRLTPLYRSVVSTKPFVTLDNRKNYSGQHVFTVIAAQGSGYIVNAPVRPNGTLAFVRATDVTLAKHDYLITISVAAREIVVYHGTVEMLRAKVAVGQAKYPTPTGVFFTREFYRPKKTTGAYGTGAFGLSGYSNVLTEFGRGDGQIAIHGTNQPQLIGQAVSHGCIRVDNVTLTKLFQTLPLGVPVVVTV